MAFDLQNPVRRVGEQGLHLRLKGGDIRLLDLLSALVFLPGSVGAVCEVTDSKHSGDSDKLNHVAVPPSHEEVHRDDDQHHRHSSHTPSVAHTGNAHPGETPSFLRRFRSDSATGIYARTDRLCLMPSSHATSEAEEMYIITVARAVEDGIGPPVPVSEIARVLEVSSVSVNQMIKKLEAAGLVDYTPYKGVTLTDTGNELANTVLRNRRLWGRFLADHLGLTPAKADEVACEMEHVTPDMVAERLASFLGDPKTGPTGRPIPGGSPTASVVAMSLTDVVVGDTATVISVGVTGVAFLRSQGIIEGAELAVQGRGADSSVLVRGPSGSVHLIGDVAGEILVHR